MFFYDVFTRPREPGLNAYGLGPIAMIVSYGGLFVATFVVLGTMWWIGRRRSDRRP